VSGQCGQEAPNDGRVHHGTHICRQDLLHAGHVCAVCGHTWPAVTDGLPGSPAAETAALPDLTTWRLALAGGYPDGIYACAWCGAELSSSTVVHRDGCRWVTDLANALREQGAAAERARWESLIAEHKPHVWVKRYAADDVTHRDPYMAEVPFADLIGGGS
jgi:hypothetical protein